MTLLTLVNDVCVAVGVRTTTSVFSNINDIRTMEEMLGLANEMAQRIATDTRDWTMLRTAVTYIGTGQEAFFLPANFQRMLTNGNVWRSTVAGESSTPARLPMRFIPDTDEWLQRRATNSHDSRGEWTIYGGQIHFWPALRAAVAEEPTSSAETARFSYLDKNAIALAGGGFGDRFMADSDSYRLPERILKLGMIWQWKALKGSPYAEDMGTWSDALALAMGTDSPAPVIIGRLPISAGIRVAYPWPVPS